MAFKLNKGLLPVKAHFFLFFAALGPILPQLNVYGRQLGVSPVVMGLVTAVLPLLWATAKPLFGYIVDYFTNQRKLIFMMLITVMSGSYCSLWFLPTLQTKDLTIERHILNLNDSVHIKNVENYNRDLFLIDKYTCHWSCVKSDHFEVFWFANSSNVSTIFVNKTINEKICGEFHMNFVNYSSNSDAICSPKPKCNLLCATDDVIENKDEDKAIENRLDNLTKSVIENNETDAKSFANNMTKEVGAKSFYSSATFWGYVVLMCIGTVAFNVANCIGDAVCFDVLGPDRGNKYGYQRAWGTVGYGVTALLGGWLIEVASSGETYKDFTPAFILIIVFTVLDLITCRRLKLPTLSTPSDAGKALRDVLRLPRVLVFIAFAVIAGTFDSFIIYYMFWYLEEMAETTGYTTKIKLIEGVVVAAQSFGGELVFFFFSGKILKKWGHGITMSFCLFCYGVRLAFISFITHPWHLVFIEAIMQGPTYALCYATIVGYAAEVAPEGYSATVQGIVAGMDDGLGFAIGSLLGGLLYSYAGGCIAFRLMALIGLLASFIHALLFKFISQNDIAREEKAKTLEPPEGERMLQEDHGYGNCIYKDTVVPIKRNEYVTV